MNPVCVCVCVCSGDPGRFMTFRNGSFKTALRGDLDCRLWSLVTVNHEKCWPPSAGMGGRPCATAIALRPLSTPLPPPPPSSSSSSSSSPSSSPSSSASSSSLGCSDGSRALLTGLLAAADASSGGSKGQKKDGESSSAAAAAAAAAAGRLAEWTKERMEEWHAELRRDYPELETTKAKQS